MRVIKKIHQFDFRKQDYFFLAKRLQSSNAKTNRKKDKILLITWI